MVAIVKTARNSSLLTRCWRGESGANQSLKWDFLGRVLRLDSKTLMDDVGSVRALFGAWIDQISLCVSRLRPPRCRFKSLEFLLFMPTRGFNRGSRRSFVTVTGVGSVSRSTLYTTTVSIRPARMSASRPCRPGRSMVPPENPPSS